MDKRILLFIFGIFMISMISASCPDGDNCIGKFEKGEGINLYQTCNNCTYGNFTSIKFPNGSNIFINVETTRDGSYFNYTLLGEYTETIGEYTYCYDFGNTAESDTGCLNFLITPNGKVFGIENALSYIGFIIVISLLFLLSLYGAIKIKWQHPRNQDNEVFGINNLRYIKVFLYLMCYMLILFLFGLSYKLFNEAGLEGFNNFFNFGYQLFEKLMYPMLIATIIIWVIIWITNQRFEKNLKLGIYGA